MSGVLSVLVVSAIASGAVAPQEALHVESGGDGPLVVLIPGLSGSAFGFRGIVPGLEAAGLSWAIIEPLAVGESPRPAAADYSLTAQADRVAVVLAQMGGQPSLVVGHGVSGSIAMRLALRHPDLVRAVVSIEGGPDENAATPTVERSLKWASLAAKLGGGRLLRDRFQSDLEEASGDRAWITGYTVRRYFSCANRDLAAAITALQAMAKAEEPQRLDANLPSIAQPVLLLVGTAPHAGSLEPAEIESLRRGLPHFAVRLIPGAGHFIFEEQPEVVIEILTAWAGASAVDLAQRGSAPCVQ
jgi:pimeloyl-ACP methyl ester carboxylesterase